MVSGTVALTQALLRLLKTSLSLQTASGWIIFGHCSSALPAVASAVFTRLSDEVNLEISRFWS